MRRAMRPDVAAKTLVRAGLAAPGIRHGLRWFINQPAVPQHWRELVHRKIAKRARFAPDAMFEHVTPNGTRLRFLHRGTPNYLYWRNAYEPDTMALFCRLAESARGVMDIGASDGIFAILAAAANPDVTILAFEPGVGAAEAFARNLELNPEVTRNVHLFNLALADEERTATLFVAGEGGGGSSLNPEFRAGTREQDVRVRRGDAVLSERGVAHVDLAKIDTESTEPAVLRGIAELLRRDHPDLIIEVLEGRTEPALMAQLEPLGYRYYRITDRGLRRQDRLAGDAEHRHLNYFFTTRDEAALSDRGIAIGPPL
jgi:FkbM family methyltransferase